jgi:hypothetical protein
MKFLITLICVWPCIINVGINHHVAQ